MKTICTLLVCFLGVSVFGQLSKVVILDGQATNTTAIYLDGLTNKTLVANKVFNAGDALTGSSTNLGLILRSQAVGVPTQNVTFDMSGAAGGLITNSLLVTWQRSFDATNWLAWTNATVNYVGTNSFYTNITYTLGEYQYIRVYNISNAVPTVPAGGVGTLGLNVYFKQ